MQRTQALTPKRRRMLLTGLFIAVVLLQSCAHEITVTDCRKKAGAGGIGGCDVIDASGQSAAGFLNAPAGATCGNGTVMCASNLSPCSRTTKCKNAWVGDCSCSCM